MYRAKAMGKNCHVVFRREMHEAVKNQLAWKRTCTSAFAKSEFFLVYQPIVDLETGLARRSRLSCAGVTPSRGVVGPVEFIPVLESSGLIVDVGRFVLMEACRQAKAWHDLGQQVGISVNVAARQLHYDVFVDHVREALEAAGLDPRYLTLEVTESMLMIDPKTTARRLSALSDLGVHIAIDDFGTGYASLSYLREFPVDILKIDRSFVSQLPTSAGTNLLDALIQLGKSLGLVTIAEGIEEISQLNTSSTKVVTGARASCSQSRFPPGEIEQVIARARYRVAIFPPSVRAVSKPAGRSQSIASEMWRTVILASS